MVADSCKVLARLQCLRDCCDALLKSQAVPACVCYVPAEIEYKAPKSTSISLFAKPSKTGEKIEVLCTTKHRVFLTAVEGQTVQGGWVQITKIMESGSEIKLEPGAQWILLNESNLVPVKTVSSLQTEDLSCWEDVVDHTYLLDSRNKKSVRVLPSDDVAVTRLSHVPPFWTPKHDYALIQVFAAKKVDLSIRDFVESIGDPGAMYMTYSQIPRFLDEGPDSGWFPIHDVPCIELVLTMKKNTVVRSLTFQFCEESSRERSTNPLLPEEITLYGGEMLLDSFRLNYSDLVSNRYTVCIRNPQHYPLIKIEFKDRGNGMGILALMIDGSVGDIGKSHDGKSHFDQKILDRQPLVSGYEQDVLYSRILLLQRIVQLFDSVLMYLMPTWEYSVRSFGFLQVISELLPISKKRDQWMKMLLKQTEESGNGEIPKLYIRRNIADLSKKPGADETVFNQIYYGLMTGEMKDDNKVISYRVPSSSRQWWECAFIGEGIIDQGGGFRDTISDIAEELCPSAADSQLLLPYFIPCPNQGNDVASNYKDAYIPNPSCMEFHKYEWIGKLMGACLRTEERLAISLSMFFWKMLTEQTVAWSDYLSVDEAQVKTLDGIEKMDADSYAAYFGETRTWDLVLSDGTSVPLKANGDQLFVSYEDRLEYIRLARELRMNESKQQVAAIRRGLLQVIPKAILQMLTLNEVEINICGNAEISFEDLKRYVIVEDNAIKETASFKYLMIVLDDFSSADRSQFVRFATGRKRLPAKIYVDSISGTDSLPSASTCGKHFYLPTYTSLTVAEKLIRMAIYNCKFIDTDTAILT